VYYWKDIEPGIADMELRDYKLTECISNFVASDAAYLSCKMEVDASSKGNALPRLFRVISASSQRTSSPLSIHRAVKLSSMRRRPTSGAEAPQVDRSYRVTALG
jgi:hypothetical protein